MPPSASLVSFAVMLVVHSTAHTEHTMDLAWYVGVGGGACYPVAFMYIVADISSA